MLTTVLRASAVAGFVLLLSACGGGAPAEKSAAAAPAPAVPKVQPAVFMTALESSEEDAKLKDMAVLEPSLAKYVRPEDKVTGLHVAAANGAVETVKVLLQNGAEADAVDAYGNTPLHNSSMNGWDEVVQALLDRGASVKNLDAKGRTPLHLAATNGHDDVIKLLLAKGADVTATDKEGKTALDLAKESNKTWVYGLLGKK